MDDNDFDIDKYPFDVLPQSDCYWEVEFEVDISGFDINIEPIYNIDVEVDDVNK